MATENIYYISDTESEYDSDSDNLSMIPQTGGPSAKPRQSGWRPVAASLSAAPRAPTAPCAPAASRAPAAPIERVEQSAGFLVFDHTNWRKMTRCRFFFKKGFCKWGNSCWYQHNELFAGPTLPK